MVCADRPDTLFADRPPTAAADLAAAEESSPDLTPEPAVQPEQDRRLRWLRFAFWGAALLVGALDAWYRPFSMSPIGPFADGVAYIDIAQAYARSDWAHALNAYWSPLYSWLLAPALRVLRPSAAAEFPVVHLVNFLIYGAALACFDFFWRVWMEEHPTRITAAGRAGWISLPPWALLAIGYSLFTWASVSLIGVQLMSPDLLVSALVYLAAGLMLHLRRSGGRPWLAALFGGILGLGFLAKAVMLPVSLVFMLVAFLPARDPRRAAAALLSAGCAFMLVAGPFMIALSRHEGRLTTGDTGRLNYAWFVNGMPQLDWQGGPAGHGRPLHPTRVLYPAPPVYEFAGPIGGTYPVWTDPAYWNAGVRVRLNGRQQARTLLKNLKKYRQLLWTDQSGLIAAVFILLLTTARLSRRRWSSLVRWDLLLVSLTPVLLYALVIAQTRYIGAFVVLFWFALLSEIKLPANETSRAVAAAATMVMLLTPAIGLARRGGRDLLVRNAGRDDWEAARALGGLGIRPGDRVGSLGLSFDIGWARLAHVSVVAELPTGREAEYWAASPSVRAAVLRAFARAGARAVVTARPPSAGLAGGWRRLGTTDRYAYLLAPPLERSLLRVGRRETAHE